MSEEQFTSPRPKKPQTRPPRRNILINLTLQVLRGLIDQLEGIVAQLENPSSPENSRNPNERNRSRHHGSKILSPIRRFLPPVVNRILPDPILAVVIGAIVVILFSQIIKQFPSREPPPELAKITVPSPQQPEIIIEKPSEEIPSEPPLSAPEVERFPTELVPDEPPASLEEVPSISEPEKVSENPDQIPQFIVETAPPQPVKFISPPNLELTPEQYLIATIQMKMNESTAKISAEIIASVQANFPASLLRVELSPAWYELSEDKQTQLAQVVFEQAQNFDFTRLELISPSGKPIARSAVIGTNMIILNRTNLESDH